MCYCHAILVSGRLVWEFKSITAIKKVICKVCLLCYGNMQRIMKLDSAQWRKIETANQPSKASRTKMSICQFPDSVLMCKIAIILSKIDNCTKITLMTHISESVSYLKVLIWNPIPIIFMLGKIGKLRLTMRNVTGYSKTCHSRSLFWTATL